MLESRIAGIPCKIRLDYISGNYVPAYISGDPDDCYEAEYPDIEFTVCDSKGRPSPWLKAKMTMADGMRIENELLESCQE
jgi:hypothetical protein